MMVMIPLDDITGGGGGGDSAEEEEDSFVDSLSLLSSSFLSRLATTERARAHLITLLGFSFRASEPPRLSWRERLFFVVFFFCLFLSCTMTIIDSLYSVLLLL